MRILSGLLAATVLAAGCGGSSPKTVLNAARDAFNPPPPPPDTIPEMLDYAADLQVNVSEMAKLPEGILWENVVEGTGKEAAGGDSLEVVWSGWLPNGVQVDTGGATFRLGAGGGMIEGLEVGIAGMKPGGRRKLVIPPGLAFGAEGSDNIPPNAVLVYDLTLRAIFP